jgi:phosphinothricin acetyltransferase
VYIHPAFYKQGIARLLYTKLFSILKTQGFVNVYAGIALPNAASVKLHKSLGFEDVGVYQKIGFKFAAWHDVLWMVKYVNTHQPDMPEPKTMESVLHLLD